MPVPPLTAHGVLPQGLHDCSFAEIEHAYTGTAYRSLLWADFQSFLQWADAQPKPTSILVDGGFTSDKQLPSDIDVVFDLVGCSAPDCNHWIGQWVTLRPWIKQQFRVDFWVYFVGANRDLRAYFEYVKPEEAILRGMQPIDRKGLLRVTI